MSALMIARITVKSPEKFKENLAKSKELAAAHGAELLFRGQVDRALNGDNDHTLAIIAQFPSIADINAWYDSPAYQPLKAVRDKGTQMQMTSYQLQD